METFHQKIVAIIKQIPRGKVATYGQIAKLAGSPRASRQVARALHTSTKKENLPWHRVINSKGKVSLPANEGYELQISMLESEGIQFGANDQINLKKYLWNGEIKEG